MLTVCRISPPSLRDAVEAGANIFNPPRADARADLDGRRVDSGLDPGPERRPAHRQGASRPDDLRQPDEAGRGKTGFVSGAG